MFKAAPKEAEKQAEACARALGWPCRGEIPADPEAGVPFEVQWAAGPALTMHFLVDDLSGSACLTLTGDHAATVEAALSTADAMLDTYTFDALLALVGTEQDPRTEAASLVRCAIGAPAEHDDRLFSLVRRFLASGDETLQEGALWAATHTPWPAYVPLLRQFVFESLENSADGARAESSEHRDPYTTVELAQHVLAGFEAYVET